MMYLNPNQFEGGAYPGLQSVKADGFLLFPEELMGVFYPADKEAAGFVNIEHDGEQVTACVWNGEAYQTWLATRPAPVEPEVEPESLTAAEIAEALLSGINDI